MKLSELWAQTHNNVCPFTGKIVGLADVMSGDYELGRIDGDSANGYEVHPSDRYISDLMTKGIKYLRYQPMLIKKISELVSATQAEVDQFIENMALNDMEIIYDSNGVMVEVRPKNWPE
jgi:hypothetical protein